MGAICFASADRFFGYPNVRVRQVKTERLDVVQAFVHVEIGLNITPVEVERPERDPRPILGRRISTGLVTGETEHAAYASEDVNLHVRPYGIGMLLVVV